MSEDSYPNRIRDVEIKRLTELAELAYRNAKDENLRIRTRESWHQKFTNEVLALNQLLKDLQYAEFERRLAVIEELRRPRRTVLYPANNGGLESVEQKEQQDMSVSGRPSVERTG